MVTSVCQSAGRTAVSGQCSGWDASLVSCCRPTNSACLVNAWSDWSACPRTCLGGQQTRTRSIIAQPSGSGAPCPSASDPLRLQTQSCDVCRSCVMSAYSNWSSCSKTCGTGQRSRTRTVTQPAECDCTPCSNVLRETQDCNTQACPVDCVLSPFSLWSGCNAMCGGGQRLRQRTIVTQPSNGGMACGSLLEQEECNSTPCMCTLNNWSDWATCSVSCGGGGTQKRTRTIASNPSNNCPAALMDSRECGVEPCPTAPPTPQPPTFVGTMRPDGSVQVDFCDPQTLAIGVAKEATAQLVGGLNVDFASQDPGDALERKMCSLQTRNGAGGILTLAFSEPMVLLSLKLTAFDGADKGELLFEDGTRKRAQRVVPLTSAVNALEASTFLGHRSYAVAMLGTSQFGIEAFTVRKPNGMTFLQPTPPIITDGNLNEIGSNTGKPIDTNEVAPMQAGDELLPLWIVLGVLACLVITLVTIYCIINRREKSNSAISVDNQANTGGDVSAGYGHNVGGGNSSAYPSHMDATSGGAPGYPTQQMYGTTMNAGSAAGGSVNQFQDAPTLDQMPTYGEIQKQSSQYGSMNKMPTASRDY
jgi:hypothetical protein